MRTIYFFMTILLLAGCSLKTNKDKAESEQTELVEQEEWVQQEDSCFVKNLKRFMTYRPCDELRNKGISYKYDDGRKLEIRLFVEQVDVSARVIDENGRKEYLELNFDGVGYESDGDMWYRMQNNEYVVGQYDFDGDGADELIIGVRSREEKDLNGVCLDVFRIKDWKRWELSSGMTVLGEADCSITLNKVKIERHLRGFYYEWSFQNGTFEDTGYY